MRLHLWRLCLLGTCAAAAPSLYPGCASGSDCVINGTFALPAALAFNSLVVLPASALTCAPPSGCALAVVANMTVSGARLTSPASLSSLNISVGGALLVANSTLSAPYARVSAASLALQQNSSIHSNGLGYGAGSGPGAASNGYAPFGCAGDCAQSAGGTGGTHGGQGGRAGAYCGFSALPAAEYGNASFPTSLGSGGAWGTGGGAAPGAGGGAVAVLVQGAALIDGSSSLSASGASVSSWSGACGDYVSQAHGAGAGGSVVLQAAAVSGAGSVLALGGSAVKCAFGGGGGGGRVLVSVSSSAALQLNLSAAGGTLNPPVAVNQRACTYIGASGSRGTVVVLQPSPSASASPTPSPTVSASPTASGTRTPTASPSASPSATPPQQACVWSVATLAGSGVQGQADGQGAAAQLYTPVGLSYDPGSQALYASDWNINRIRKVTLAGAVTTVTAYSGLGSPTGFPIDAQGNMLITDFDYGLVRRLSPAGAVTTVASGLVSPTSILLDATGAFAYITEQQFGNRVRRLTMATSTISTLAGHPTGNPGFADAVGTLALFNAPTQAALHPSGTLYVADGVANQLPYSNNRIRTIDIASASVTTLAGNGIVGGADGIGTAATFNSPRGVALDPTNSVLYITEGTGNRVRSITLSTALVQTIAGSGAAGFADGIGTSALFFDPIFIASAPSGALYVADSLNNRIRVLTRSCPNAISCPPGSYRNTSACATCPFGNSTAFSSPCLSCPASYYCSSGTPLLCPAGSACPMGSVNATLCPAGSFSPAGASACSPCPAGTYFFAGACTQCPIGAYCAGGAALNVSCYPVSACAVAGLSAQPPCYWNVKTLAGGPSSLGTWLDGVVGFWYVQWVLPDPSGRFVYASTFQGRVRKVTFDGTVTTAVGGLTGMVFGMAFDNNGSLIIADGESHSIRSLRLSDNALTLLAGNGAASSIDGAATSASFLYPTDIAVSSSGDIFVAETHLIRRIRAGSVSAFAGSGVAGWADGVGSAAQFFKPYGICISSANVLYVADTWNNRIRMITPGRLVTTFAGNGVGAHLDGQGTASSFYQPESIALDPFNNLFVVERENFDVRMISPAGWVVTLFGSRISGYRDGFLPLFSYPRGIKIDAHGALFIADSGNFAIRWAQCVPCPISHFCVSGLPVLCPAGSACPMGSVNATLCPAGSFSPAGASACSLCPAGSTSTANSTSAAACAPLQPAASSTPSPTPTLATALAPLTRPVFTVTTIAGSGGAGSTDGAGSSASFDNIIGLCLAADQLIIVPDNKNHRLRAISNGIVTTLAGSGNPAWQDGTGAAASFKFPSRCAVSPSNGQVFVADADNLRIRSVTLSGVVSTFAGSGLSGSANGMGTAASFYGPFSLSFDSASNLYVLDVRYSVTTVIRVIAPSGSVSTLSTPGTSLGGFGAARGLTVGSQGRLYITDTDNFRIVVLTTAGAQVSTYSSQVLYGYAQDCALDAAGNLYMVLNWGCVVVMLTPGGVFSTVAGSGTCASIDGVGTGAGFAGPFGLAMNAAFTKLFVADSSSSNVREVLLAPANISQVAGSLSRSPTTSATASPSPSPTASVASSSSATAASAARAPAGAACTAAAGCASGACSGGFCCSANAARMGCTTCAVNTGVCVLYSPGDTCASSSDCGTNLCLGGCCCASSAVLSVGCSACQCWGANASTTATTAATAGACTANPTMTLTLPCNASVSIPSAAALSRVISFGNLSVGADPLLLLPAVSPLNTWGADVIIASAPACAAFAAQQQGGAQACSAAGPVYVSAGGLPYFYLGSAAALAMVATPACGA